MATHLKMTNTKGKEEMTISKKAVPEHICRSKLLSTKGFKRELNAKGRADNETTIYIFFC